MLSNHLILFCHSLLLFSSIFSIIRVFSSESMLCISWLSIGSSASATDLPLNTQDWFPLGLTDLISLESKGLSRVFSGNTLQKHQFFSILSSFMSSSHIHMDLPSGSAVINSLAMQELQGTWVWSLHWEESLEEGMTTYSSSFTCRIPRIEDPGELQSIG